MTDIQEGRYTRDKQKDISMRDTREDRSRRERERDRRQETGGQINKRDSERDGWTDK